MKIFNLIMILFVIVCIFIIVLSVSKSSEIDDKKANPDIPDICTGSSCKIECGVLSPNTIKQCTINTDGTSICSNCRCDSSGKLSGCMECKESDPSSDDPKKIYAIKDISRDQCTDPFFWDDKNSICKLKKGTYCLPPDVTDITCNKFTGRKLLTLDTKTNTYKWTCNCIDDRNFSGPTCSYINVCGMEGSTENPDNTYTNRGLYKKNNPNNYWNQTSDWDPYQEGQCKCSNNEEANNSNLTCMPNDCTPAGTKDQTDPQKCNCTAKGFIDCKSISLSFDPLAGNIFNGVCRIPSCVPDPCAGKDGNAGKYGLIYDDSKKHIIGGQCICNSEDGYSLAPDPTAFGGWSCQQLCKDNGPCGDRGKCNFSIDQVFDQFTIICNNNDGGKCSSPFTFSIRYGDDKNPYYLNYNIETKKLTFKNTIDDGSKFNFMLNHCQSGESGPNCKIITSKVEQGVSSNNDYYILLENVTGKNYLSFKADKDGNYNLMGDSDPNLKNSLFNFSNTNEDKRPSSVNKGLILIKSLNKYLSVIKGDPLIKGDPPTILFKTQNTSGAYCGDYDDNTDTYVCYTGYRQDSNLMCASKCLSDGQWAPLGVLEEPPSDALIKSICCSGKKKDQKVEKVCIQWNPGVGPPFFPYCTKDVNSYTIQCA